MHPSLSLAISHDRQNDLTRAAERGAAIGSLWPSRWRSNPGRSRWGYFRHASEAHEQPLRGTDGRALGA